NRLEMFSALNVPITVEDRYLILANRIIAGLVSIGQVVDIWKYNFIGGRLGRAISGPAMNNFKEVLI
ncbi:hypothetical protein ACFL2E_10685, partial [Thermodesulfobacteriota bacterium]